MTVFVKLREGHEPFAVNPDAVAALQGMAGGRETLVVLLTGGSERVQHSVDAVLSLFAAAAGRPADWLDQPAQPKARGRG